MNEVNNFPNIQCLGNMGLYNKCEQFVLDAFKGNENDIRHAERTVYWIRQLKPDADEALLIAGLAHDIERASHGDWKKGSDDPGDLRKHQDLSASEIEKFLKNQNAGKETMKRIKMLVSHHEEGGDADQNVLCDADCLSFFEDKVLRRVQKLKKQGESKEAIKKKLDYYFSRIISTKAKEIARQWYEKALEEMEK